MVTSRASRGIRCCETFRGGLQIRVGVAICTCGVNHYIATWNRTNFYRGTVGVPREPLIAPTRWTLATRQRKRLDVKLKYFIWLSVVLFGSIFIVYCFPIGLHIFTPWREPKSLVRYIIQTGCCTSWKRKKKTFEA